MATKSSRWWLRQDSEQVIVDAPPQRIYELLADLPRMGDWSAECRQVEWTDGAVVAEVGARFIGHNRGGPKGILKWSRRGRVLVADPGRELAFVTEEGGKESTIWRYQFEPTDSGTLVTESYDVKSIPAWARIVDVPTNRAGELREGMRHTLAQLKSRPRRCQTPWANDDARLRRLVDRPRRTTHEGDEISMITTYSAAPDIDVITSSFPIPGFGLVPINAFVLHGAEPVLVDTGAVVERDEFMTALRSVIDPGDIKWIWLTHPDFDHIGSLGPLLDAYPDIRVITTFLGVGILSLSAPLPMDRVHLVNPGQKITIGERTLTAVKPPAFDNPSTTGFVDESCGVLFSSDCFGALLAAVPDSAADLTEEDLRQGQIFWGTVDAPWLHNVDRTAFAGALERIRRIEPTMVLSSHLPAAPGAMLDQLIGSLAAVPTATPFVGPDQAALEAMLAEMTNPVSE